MTDEQPPTPGTVVMQRERRWWRFRDPIEVLRATRLEEVGPVFEQLERASTQGRIAAGFLSYEAAPALDATLTTHRAGSLPLAWFGIYREGENIEDPGVVEAPGAELSWQPSISAEQHREAIAKIRSWIAQGETYQVNLTFRLGSRFEGDSWQLFRRLVAAQGAEHCAYLDLGDHAIASVSPELFFRLEGDRITMRPMKGTASRGRTSAEDLERAEALRSSAKERAENLMIVDMIRNDLGRIARAGSVQVERLYEVERYRSVYQLTSTVAAETDASLREVVAAVFPSASVTGAPKVRTMQLIRELEPSPRGVYTGAIGMVGPGRSVAFNVAIRTLHLDRERGWAEYGTGGGIVWDSDPEAEYEECRTKALVLTEAEVRPTLLETLAWSQEGGFLLLDRHLERLADSAAYFGIPVDLDAVRSQLDQAVAGRHGGRPLRPEEATAGTEDPGSNAPIQRSGRPPCRPCPEGEKTADWKVRLLVAPNGEIRGEIIPLTIETTPIRLRLAPSPIDPTDRRLFHKTTDRDFYEAARRSAPEADDVLLWNPKGELTESTIANLVVQIDGHRITPPVGCGLLAGTFRAELLERGELREGVVRLERIPRADNIWLVNSVRGWMAVQELRAAEGELLWGEVAR